MKKNTLHPSLEEFLCSVACVTMLCRWPSRMCYGGLLGLGTGFLFPIHNIPVVADNQHLNIG